MDDKTGPVEGAAEAIEERVRRKRSAHLTRDEALSVRRWYDAGYGIVEIAEMSGLSRKTVSRIAHRKTHKRLQPIDKRNLPRLPMRRPDQVRPKDPNTKPRDLQAIARYLTRRR